MKAQKTDIPDWLVMSFGVFTDNRQGGMMDSADPAWLRTEYQEEGSIVFATNVDPSNLLRAVGGSGTVLRPPSPDDVLDPRCYPGGMILRAGRAGNWSYCFHMLGVDAASVTEWASRNGEAVSFMWNVNALTWIEYARSGRIEASFEPGVSGGFFAETNTPALVELLRTHHEQDESFVELFNLACRELGILLTRSDLRESEFATHTR
ncbi:hypothetical protein B4N89_35960 [Embleya scabrispora]|uniref:Uncharacterized protein n=1 Tax=Embleya scabrispora TaxID=159449 RepID=A0A1T3NLD9_9ACTN|nr:hypothetical protein B4N89_35960 [Embleya scabrispora]